MIFSSAIWSFVCYKVIMSGQHKMSSTSMNGRIHLSNSCKRVLANGLHMSCFPQPHPKRALACAPRPHFMTFYDQKYNTLLGKIRNWLSNNCSQKQKPYQQNCELPEDQQTYDQRVSGTKHSSEVASKKQYWVYPKKQRLFLFHGMIYR